MSMKNSDNKNIKHFLFNVPVRRNKHFARTKRFELIPNRAYAFWADSSTNKYVLHVPRAQAVILNETSALDALPNSDASQLVRQVMEDARRIQQFPID